MTRKPRTQSKLNGLGQIMGAVPDMRVLRDEVCELLSQGGTDEAARALALKRGQTLGITGPKTLIASLTLKLMRMDFRTFLHKLADEIANRYEHKRVADFADNLWGAMVEGLIRMPGER